MISIRNLYKNFGNVKVLQGLSLDVEPNKVTVIMGRSGQGKSVLLKHIMGLLKPDRGEIFVGEYEVTALQGEELYPVRRRCGMLFQDAALFDSMDVFDNVAFPLLEHTDLDDAAIAEKVIKTLATVGLQGVEERWPNELSGGMRKRVGLARALVLEPEILLYDEPTTGLDPITSAQINELIKETQQRLSMTALVISHDLMSTKQIADHVVMLHEGKIIESAAAANFFNSKNPAIGQFLRGLPQGPMTTTRDQEL